MIEELATRAEPPEADAATGAEQPGLHLEGPVRGIRPLSELGIGGTGVWLGDQIGIAESQRELVTARVAACAEEVAQE